MTSDRTTADPGGLKTPRTTLRRKPDRGSHDWDTIAAILDEARYCHMGFAVDGQPYVIPTAFGRDARTLYIHGSSASRMLRTLSGGIPICFTATLIDGLIYARSSFHSSVHYRSVVALGSAAALESEEEKLRGLEVISEHTTPGHWYAARIPSRKELKAVSVLRLDVGEASAKVRMGGAVDEPEDMDLPVWAGVLPLALVAGTPETDPLLRGDHPVPAHVRDHKRPGAQPPMSS